MAKKRGGSRPGAGRKPSLTAEQREDIFGEYHRRMKAWAFVQARARDPILKRRRAIDSRMREIAKTHKLADEPRAEDVIWAHVRLRPRIEKLQTELDSLPNKGKTPTKRAKGPRERFIRELASEWSERLGRRVSERMIVRCINEFDFGT